SASWKDWITIPSISSTNRRECSPAKYRSTSSMSAVFSGDDMGEVCRGEGTIVWARPYGLTRRLARKLARVAVGSGPAVEPQLREAPVMSEGSWVGLDVHARSGVAGVIDHGSGEVRALRLPPGAEATQG